MHDRLKVARVRWFLGQSLLPEHLTCSEQSLGAEAHLRASLSGQPEYGVARLRWNEELLADGVLAVTALTVVLRDGTLIDVPRNAVTQQLTLAVTGASLVPVYLHVLEQTESAAGNPLYTDDPKIVQRVFRRVQLAITEKLERSTAALKLAEFERSVSGRWRLHPDYLPPLLQIGDTPFLHERLGALKEALEVLEPKLLAQLQDTFLRLERLAAIRGILADIYEVSSLLADLRHGLGRHPYDLFQILRHFYFHLCSFHEMLPEESTLAYSHAEIGRSFSRLFTLMSPRLQLSSVHHSHAKFVHRNGLFSLASMPDVAKSAQEVYLLIQRPNIHDRVDTADVKLSATSRLALVHRMVLRGIPFKFVDRVHFQHAFGPEVDFYQLTLNDEWGLAAREGSVAFYETPQLEKSGAYLFWR